jgi:hypothetical protein
MQFPNLWRNPTIGPDWYNTPEPRSPWDDIQFGFMDDEEEDVSQEETENQGVSPYIRQMNQMMRQPRTAYTEYLKHIAGMPNREDYAPNTLQKIGAVLAGVSGGLRGDVAGGIQNARAIADYPYMRAFEDWGAKGKGLSAAAELESEQMKQAYDNLLKAENERIDLINANASASRARSSNITANAYRDAMNFPNYFAATTGDRTYLIDRKNRAPRIDLGASPGAAQRNWQGVQNSLDRSLRERLSNASIDAAMDRLRERNAFELENPSSTQSRRFTISTADQYRARQLAIRDIISDPQVDQRYKDFIKLDKDSGSYIFKPPPAGDAEGVRAFNKLKREIEDRARREWYPKIQEY